MAIKKPLVLYDGIQGALQPSDNIQADLDASVASSIATRAESIGRVAESLANEGGSSYYDIPVSEMYLDSTNTGSDYNTAFNIYPCVDFEPSSTGSIYAVLNFKNSGFSTDSNILIDLKYSFDGTITASKAVYITSSGWITDTAETPGSADSTQSRTVTVNTDDTYELKEYSSFHTIPSSNFNTNTQMLVIKITRTPDNANDTYDGTMKLLRIVARQ